jgi:hypothetical protein
MELSFGKNTPQVSATLPHGQQGRSLGWIVIVSLQRPQTHRSRNSREFLAQLLHRFLGDFGFAQHLHKARRCTEFAQDFLPLLASKCEKYLAIKGEVWSIYEQ